MMRVLLVDDDHMSCRCLEQLIDWGAIGCEKPICAYDGAEAYELIKKEPPDIVVSDVKMPVMDGKELCRLIYENYPDVSLFFVSAYGDFDTAQLALRYHVKGYVLKPLDRDALSALMDMIGEAAARQENLSFVQKICEDEYRDVLRCAIEEKDREMVEEICNRLEKLQEHLSFRDSTLWQHLIAPVIDYKNVSLKMDYGILFDEERRVLKLFLQDPIEQRIPRLKNYYLEVMREEKPNDNYVIREIQRIVQEQFSFPDLDISEMAQRFGRSSVYLGRLFIEQTGMKFTDYLQEKRLAFACERLRYSEQVVREIAELSGYRDAGYFNKVFRKKMGLTPMEYREKYHR